MLSIVAKMKGKISCKSNWTEKIDFHFLLIGTVPVLWIPSVNKKKGRKNDIRVYFHLNKMRNDNNNPNTVTNNPILLYHKQYLLIIYLFAISLSCWYSPAKVKMNLNKGMSGKKVGMETVISTTMDWNFFNTFALVTNERKKYELLSLNVLHNTQQLFACCLMPRSTRSSWITVLFLSNNRKNTKHTLLLLLIQNITRTH